MMHSMTRGLVWALRFFWPLVFYEAATGIAGVIAGREHLWFALFGGAVIAIPVFCAVYRKKKRRGMPGAREIAFRFAAGAVLGVVLNFVMAVSGLSRYAGSYEQAAEQLFTMPVSLQLAGMCILAPFAEELMFRGLAYGQLRETFPVKTSAVLSALYFGAAHGNIAQGIYGFIVGLFLAKSYEETGLSGSFAMHMGANIAAVLLSAFFGI